MLTRLLLILLQADYITTYRLILLLPILLQGNGVQRINAAFLMLTILLLPVYAMLTILLPILLLPVYAYYRITYITTGEWGTTN